MSNRPLFGAPYGSRRGNGAQTLLKSARKNFDSFSSSFIDKYGSKGCLFVISEILGLFVDVLFSNGKYSPNKGKNLKQVIKIKIS